MGEPALAAGLVHDHDDFFGGRVGHVDLARWHEVEAEDAADVGVVVGQEGLFDCRILDGVAEDEVFVRDFVGAGEADRGCAVAGSVAVDFVERGAEIAHGGSGVDVDVDVDFATGTGFGRHVGGDDFSGSGVDSGRNRGPTTIGKTNSKWPSLKSTWWT